MVADHLFLWERHPDAEKIVETALGKAINQNDDLKLLHQKLLSQTSSRLFDWVDHVIISMKDKNLIESSGYRLTHAHSDYEVYSHPGAQLPRILLKEQVQPVSGVAIVVDSISEFLLIHGGGSKIEGSPHSGFRRNLISDKGDVSFWVVERTASEGVEPISENEKELIQFYKAKELWDSRVRSLETESDEGDQAMSLALKTVKEIVDLIGPSKAASLILERERVYWQAKNRAGQIQKNRQDTLGMGWANHDHHTFRSSRKHFYALVKFFEILGFHCRERFYAGEEAGWGAQVMEHNTERLVLFLDVDLQPDEIAIDFSHQKLPEIKKLGTIGLWCALHGDSLLSGGMHHLEAQFMFDELREDLQQKGVRMMSAFSDFPYLKQAFTEGDYWPVNPVKLAKLLVTQKITQAQHDRFLEKGAIGSHLENLQRREGYKGFNQKNVSSIIKKTDPRQDHF